MVSVRDLWAAFILSACGRYDNEMGYSNRVIDLITFMQTKD